MKRKKTKTWTFKTKKEAADFFVTASFEMDYTKGNKIVTALQPNKVRITLLPFKTTGGVKV